MEIDSDVNSNHSDPDTQVLSDLNVNNCSSTHFREIRSFSFKKENGTCNGDYMKYDKLFLEEDEAKMECDALTCNQVMHSNKMLDANKDDDFLNSYNEEGDTDIGSEDEGAFCEQTNGHQNLFAEKGSRYGSLTFETRQSADASEEMSSTIEAEDGEILEDGEIADDDDLYRDESEGSPEIQEQRENTSVEMNEDDEETILKTDQKEKRKLKRNKRRKDKNKKKYKRLEYIDHDRIDDEISKQGWTGSGKKSSPGPNESPTSKHSPQGPFDSPYHRSPPGPYDSPYESPPGIYDSPSEDEDSPDCFPNKPKKSLLSMVDDGFMDPNVAANEKEDMFQARRRGCGRNAPGLRRNKKQYDGHSHHHHHHHHMPKKKPLLETPPHMRTPCKFFKEGKCAKGCDCPFGHDFKPPRKPDICKFYLNSVCTKGDNCLYMHGEYPCKFFHTGSTCYQGDTCKFSHEPLTEETKILLEKILDNRDDEKSEHEMCQPSKPRPSLLGSPPRHLKESVRQNSDRNRDKHPPPPPPPPWEMIHSQCKKIPSLLDIKVYPPGQSPKKQSSLQGQPASRPGFYKEVMNSPTNSNSSASKPGGLNQGTLVQQQGQTSPYHRGSSVDGLPPSPPSQTTAMSPQHPLSSSGSFSGQVASDGDIASQSQDDICSTQSQEDRNFSEEERLEAELLCRKQASFEIPAHLPPRQRELFLRIQQQQRQTTNEIENIQDKNKVEDDDDWYSSDEDGATPTPKLTDILKNLSQQPSQPAVQNPPSQSGATGQPSAVSIMQMINNAMRSSPVTTNSLPLSTSKRDPRLQSHKPPDRAAGQQGSNSQGNPGDPRLQIGKLSNTIEPPSTITVSKSSVQLPYHLFEIKTDQKRTLPLNVDMFDPRFKNDPRIKRQLSQSESGNQKAATQKIIDTEKNLPKSVDPRLGKTNASEDATQSAPRPTDPRLNRASQLNIPGDPRLLLKKTEQKEVLPELTKPTVPHLPRTSSDQSVASKKIDPRLQRMQSTPPGMHVLPVRALDPRLMRQQQEASKCPAQPPPPLPLPPPPPPPPPPSRAVDPRVTRQQNSDQTVRPNKSNAPRLARPPTDLDVGTIPKLDPRLARQQDSPVPRQSDPRLLRQINQSENQVKAEVTGQQAETQPPDLKMDYRNDPRFKRKASADIGSSSNLAQPPVKKKFTGQRKGSMEYSSPLGIEMDKPESSGYNSYNRPLNTNRQAANTTKSRTSGSDQSSSGLSNIQDVCSRKNTALATEPGISQLPPGISQQMYQQQPPVNPQPLSPQQQLLVNPQQPKLKDLFKTIDPTASPFC